MEICFLRCRLLPCSLKRQKANVGKHRPGEHNMDRHSKAEMLYILLDPCAFFSLFSYAWKSSIQMPGYISHSILGFCPMHWIGVPDMPWFARLVGLKGWENFMSYSWKHLNEATDMRVMQPISATRQKSIYREDTKPSSENPCKLR